MMYEVINKGASTHVCLGSSLSALSSMKVKPVSTLSLLNSLYLVHSKKVTMI